MPIFQILTICGEFDVDQDRSLNSTNLTAVKLSASLFILICEKRMAPFANHMHFWIETIIFFHPPHVSRSLTTDIFIVV